MKPTRRYLFLLDVLIWCQTVYLFKRRRMFRIIFFLLRKLLNVNAA